MKIKPYREFTLDNGLTIALWKTETPLIAGELSVNFGSFHEKDGEKGRAHLLEHVLTNAGTQKYSPEEYSKIQSYFGYTNASINLGGTKFVIGMIEKYFEQGLEFLSETAFRPRFDPKVTEAQKEIVLREMSDLQAGSKFKDMIKCGKALFRNHPGRDSGIGKRKDIVKATVGDLKGLHERGYHPNNMYLVFVGNIPANAEKLIKEHFESYKPGNSTFTQFPELMPLKKKTIIHSYAPDLLDYTNPDESSATITLGFVMPPEERKESFESVILNLILGKASEDSRLFRRIRDREKLAYSVLSQYHSGYNFGYIIIDTAVPSKRKDEAISIIFEELERLKQEKVSDEELENVKRYIEYVMALSFETNQGHINEINRIRDYSKTMEDYLKGYELVTPEKIHKAAKKYLPSGLKDNNYVLLIRDPLKKK